MVNAQLDILELELRKLDGIRSVGFSSQHDVLYIQLFVDSDSPSASLPFESTRIAQRHSSSPVAVELVRWTNLVARQSEQKSGLASIFANTDAAQAVSQDNDQLQEPKLAGTISRAPVLKESEQPSDVVVDADAEPIETNDYDETNDIREEPTDFIDMSQPETFEEMLEDNNVDQDNEVEAGNEVDLAAEEINESDIAKAFQASNESKAELQDQSDDDSNLERIALLLVTTSPENDEIEVHLAFDEQRTIGRAPTNRGLLGAIDATVEAIGELTGANEFHAEWARSLEPGAEHASLVAVGLTNGQGSDTRHGIAGGSSPIEAAARATLNALNRTAVFS